MQKYLKFIEQYENINQLFELTYYEIKLLDMVAKANYFQQNIFVGDLIGQRNVASQATLHAAFKRLMEKKLLITKQYLDDGRIKKVLITKLALERYMRLEVEISKSVSCKKKTDGSLNY
jgi:DNA-binding MarR family transcriptional regulator